MTTSLPRSPVSRSAAGTVFQGSSAASSSRNTDRSRMLCAASRTWATASWAAPRDATGTPGVSWAPRTRQTSQRAAREPAAPAASRRRSATARTIRITDRVTTAGTATATRTAPATTASAQPGPNDSPSMSTPAPTSRQSLIGLNGRCSASRKPRSRILRTASRPSTRPTTPRRPVPAAAAAGGRARRARGTRAGSAGTPPG